jgi:hypothetical protein
MPMDARRQVVVYCPERQQRDAFWVAFAGSDCFQYARDKY